MIYAAHHKDFASYVGHNVAKRNAVAKKAGILRRIFDAIRESRQRQTDRAIASFIAQRGGRITDDLEREMTRRLLTSNWSADR